MDSINHIPTATTANKWLHFIFSRTLQCHMTIKGKQSPLTIRNNKVIRIPELQDCFTNVTPAIIKSDIKPPEPLQHSRQITRHICSTRICLSDQRNQLTKCTEENGIRTICLDNPKKRNALSLAMLTQLEYDLYRDADNVRVIILTHTGPVFSAGHDLKELTSKEGREYHSEVFAKCTSVMSSLQDLPVPVIAKISVFSLRNVKVPPGMKPIMVLTSGLLLVEEDLRYPTQHAQTAPRVNVGLFCSTPAVPVGRSVPRKVAMEMLFTGEPITAQDALLHGLVSRVVPEEKLDEETSRVANKICEFSKSVISLGKRTFYHQIALDRKSAYDVTGQVMVDNLSLTYGQEGIKAFIEKRKPTWSHDYDKAH